MPESEFGRWGRSSGRWPKCRPAAWCWRWRRPSAASAIARRGA